MTGPLSPGTVAAGASAIGGAVAGLKQIGGLVPGADAANAVIDGITATRRWISDRHNWTRALWFASGMTLIMIGAVVIGHKPLGAAAGTVIPVGKAGKIVKRLT